VDESDADPAGFPTLERSDRAPGTVAESGECTVIRPARAVLVIVLAVAACLVASCDEEERYGEPPPLPSSRPPSPTHASPSGTAAKTDEQQILAQYHRFWTDALPRAYAATAPQRRAILAPVTTDPELGVLLRNMSIQDAGGERGYGTQLPLKQSLERSGALSLVRGCLNSRNAGVLRAATGKKLTRGPERNPVLVNLKKSADSSWRVSFVKYPGGSQC
jgi:hypothetical protein